MLGSLADISPAAPVFTLRQPSFDLVKAYPQMNS
jgi:hypothetical protein